MKLKQNYIILYIILLFGCNQIKQKEEKSSTENDTLKSTEITVNEKQYNFGTVKSDTVIQKKFYIRNIGENDLFVLDSHASCTCTSNSIDKKKIQTGDSLCYSLEIDMKGKKGFTRIVGFLSLNTPKTYYKFTVEGEVE